MQGTGADCFQWADFIDSYSLGRERTSRQSRPTTLLSAGNLGWSILRGEHSSCSSVSRGSKREKGPNPMAQALYTYRTDYRTQSEATSQWQWYRTRLLIQPRAPGKQHSCGLFLTCRDIRALSHCSAHWISSPTKAAATTRTVRISRAWKRGGRASREWSRQLCSPWLKKRLLAMHIHRVHHKHSVVQKRQEYNSCQIPLALQSNRSRKRASLGAGGIVFSKDCTAPVLHTQP